MTGEVTPLFGAPPRRSFTLSERFAGHAGPAKYGSSSSRQPCDECIALQHETAGRSGTRAPVRYVRKRQVRRGGQQVDLQLLLCAPHKELWTELDAAAA